MCLTYESVYEFAETREITIPLLLPEYVEVIIGSDPTDVPFKIDGVELTTPTQVKVTPGTYHITFPKTFQGMNFDHWEDGSTYPVRDVELTENKKLFASYKKPIEILPFLVAGCVGAVLVPLIPLALKRR